MEAEEAFKFYELPMTATQKEVNKKYTTLVKKYPPSSTGEKLDMYMKICEAKKVITAYLKKGAPKKAPMTAKPEETTCPNCLELMKEISELQKKYDELDEKRKSSILQISKLLSLTSKDDSADLKEDNERLKDVIDNLQEERQMLMREIEAIKLELFMSRR